jgi:hypothetical protein
MPVVTLCAATKVASAATAARAQKVVSLLLLIDTSPEESTGHERNFDDVGLH